MKSNPYSMLPELYQPQSDWRDARRRDDIGLKAMIQLRDRVERLKTVRLLKEAQLVARSNR